MHDLFVVVIETIAAVAFVTLLGCLIAVAAARFVGSERPVTRPAPTEAPGREIGGTGT